MPVFDSSDDDEDRKEYDLRSALMAGFEAFDSGDLTADNALSFELPEPDTRKEKTSADEATKQPDASAAASKGAVDAGGGTGDRLRDERGRFAQRDGQPPANEADKPRDASAGQAQKPGDKPAAADQTKQGDAGNTQPQTPAASSEPPPQGIGAKAAAIWATASPETRAYIAETEQALARVAEPFQEIFNAAKEISVPWNQYAGNLVKVERYLRSNPLDAMVWIAKQQNVDLDELADYAAQSRSGAPAAPGNPDLQRAIAPIATQVTQLQQQLAQREQSERQAREQAEQQRIAAVKREVEAFAADPKNEHWPAVDKTVYSLLPAVRQEMPNATIPEVLKAAYDRAIWANPAVREKVQAAARAAEAERQRHARSRQLESLTGHRGSPEQTRQPLPNGKEMSLRDEIAANWALVDAR